MGDVAAVTNNIQQRTRDDGFLGLNRNEHLHQTVEDLKALTADERNQVAAGLSDDDLQELADDVNASGLGGANGLSADEKRDLFNTLAEGLDGKQLARLAKAFDDRQDVMALGQAVAQHADSDTKVAFIKEMAPRTADDDHDSGVMVGGSWSEAGDKEAEAILDVLSSMGNDPAAFNEAINALDDATLDKVATAGLNQHTTYGESSVSVSHDPKQLTALLRAASSSNDPAVKARVFDAGAGALQKMRDDTRFPVVGVGTDQAAKQVADGLTQLLNTDVRGIVNELQKADQYGKGLSIYTSEVLRADPKAGAKTIGNQLAQLQGAGTGMDPAHFIEQQAPGTTGKPYYQNAENLGYYTGAMRLGLDNLNTDATTQGTIIKSIILTAVSAASLGRGSGITLATGANVVDAMINEANGNRTELGQGLQDLALPLDARGNRYEGPAAAAYNAKVSIVRHN
ncbi:MAG: hypothetical protein QM772_11660 [Ottowia sp.]|uniref:hypothetical protein n=1 Tax=Ottowia sp. TaxID=1898956 RepID=UPI0039E62754